MIIYLLVGVEFRAPPSNIFFHHLQQRSGLNKNGMPFRLWTQIHINFENDVLRKRDSWDGGTGNNEYRRISALKRIVPYNKSYRYSICAVRTIQFLFFWNLGNRRNELARFSEFNTKFKCLFSKVYLTDKNFDFIFMFHF